MATPAAQYVQLPSLAWDSSMACMTHHAHAMLWSEVRRHSPAIQARQFARTGVLPACIHVCL